MIQFDKKKEKILRMMKSDMHKIAKYFKKKDHD